MTELATVAPSALAIVVSVYALYVSRDSARRARDEGAIKSSYDEFERLSALRMEHWPASHLLEMPENYAQIKSCIAQALEPLTDAERNELLLRERAIATEIFGVFEETCYHRERAKKRGDRDRVDFLDSVLAYFTGRLLANPRLRWLWSPDGGNLCAYFEPETIGLYESALVAASDHAPGNPIDLMDPIGPYLSAAGDK